MAEILSREEVERAGAGLRVNENWRAGDPGLEDFYIATIEALAGALAVIDEDDGFQLAKTSLDAMEPLRKKGWL